MNIKWLMEESYKTAAEKGWFEPAKTFPEELLMLHTEISEAVEEYRAGYSLSKISTSENGKPEGVPIELADLVIRVAQMCAWYRLDLEMAIGLKLAYNKIRPRRHGDKLI